MDERSTAKESVWNYPRPPRVEAASRRARVRFAGRWVADSQRALRVLETSHPPTYYFPREDVDMALLLPVKGFQTFCEWKGHASYFDLEWAGKRSGKAAWTYREPAEGFALLKGCIAFYPSRVDACFLDDEQIRPQRSTFYGGWISSDIQGPFKGGAGTAGW
jgi:uncharacterized protein (DUF427 family)